MASKKKMHLMTYHEVEMAAAMGEAMQATIRFGKRLDRIARILNAPKGTYTPTESLTLIARAVGKDTFKRVGKKISRAKKIA